MTPKQVKDIFNKLPSKRRKVLVGFLAGHSREKIMIDADVPSDAALTGHLKELYKNFRINTGWNDADDRRSGTRKLPLLISLFARSMPELISDRIPEVPDHIEQEEAIAKPQRESEQPDTSSIEERIFRATEQLNSRGFSALVGIQALEEIAKDSPRYHWKIMELLAAFVRENAPRKGEKEGEEERSPKLPDDIQAAFTVIGRRDPNNNNGSLDLSNTNIRRAYLPDANLQRVNLQKACLKQAILREAHLDGATLDEAHLEQVDLMGAYLEGASLERTYLEQAIFNGAYLKGAKFYRAHLKRVHFDDADLERVEFVGACLEYATLIEANLEDADLRGANLTNATLRRVSLRGANFEGAILHKAHLEETDVTVAKNLEASQIETAYGDSPSSLPQIFRSSEDWNLGK